ncbi:hypothetical protein BGZ59_008751, partial [Podila verticillata]
QATPSAPSAPLPTFQSIDRDITSYNFSDRKTTETAPSAPPASTEHPLALTSQQDMQRWLDYYAQQQYPAGAQAMSGHRAQRSDPGVRSQAESSIAPQRAPVNRDDDQDEEEPEATEAERERDEDSLIPTDNNMIPLKSRSHSQESSVLEERADPSPYYETRHHSEGPRSVNYSKPLPKVVEDRRTPHERSYSTADMELQGDNNHRGKRNHGKSPRRGAMGRLPASGIRMPNSTGLSTEIAQSLIALEETIDKAFENLGDSWVQKIQRAATTPVQAAVNHATTNAVAAVNHATTNAVAAAIAAEKAKFAAAEQASTAVAMAAGVWADEKAKLVNAAGEQREKIKLVFGPWSKEF